MTDTVDFLNPSFFFCLGAPKNPQYCCNRQKWLFARFCLLCIVQWSSQGCDIIPSNRGKFKNIYIFYFIFLQIHFTPINSSTFVMGEGTWAICEDLEFYFLEYFHCILILVRVQCIFDNFPSLLFPISWQLTRWTCILLFPLGPANISFVAKQRKRRSSWRMYKDVSFTDVKRNLKHAKLKAHASVSSFNISEGENGLV